jgi:hypothetical protein
MAELPTLSEKQLRFCAEYACEPNATQAYIKAFNTRVYSTARVEGPKLLLNPAILAEIEVARIDYRKRCGISFAKIVRKLATIALGDPDDLYEPDPENDGLPKPRAWATIPPAARKNIVTVKLKRRKLKPPKPKKGQKADDCLYEIEEMEYKVLDPMAALDKLCLYLGVTKGSLTVEDLRTIVAGEQAAQAPQGTQAGGPASSEGGTPPEKRKPGKRHPDE